MMYDASSISKYIVFVQQNIGDDTPVVCGFISAGVRKLWKETVVCAGHLEQERTSYLG